ncbi:MAG: asparaginase [Bacillota bacterium]
MSEVLVNVFRGEKVENIHRGDVVAVNRKGEIIAAAGNPYKVTFMRSCAKPIQAFSVLESGAADLYGFDDKEIAVMCSSHYAEDFHVKAVEDILKKIGLSEDRLNCGATYSLNEKVTEQLIKSGKTRRRIYNNCSGKHAGMLALAVKEGIDIQDYDAFHNKVQQIMLRNTAYFCGIEADKIGIGIDGCGTPVYEMPIYNMAMAFSKIAKPEGLPEKKAYIIDRIAAAMNKHPEMIAGTGGFCTELMRNTGGRMIAKLGAAAVYCVGIRDLGIGIAVKIESGAADVLSTVVLETLKQLEYVNAAELEKLKEFHYKNNLNTQNKIIGQIAPVFKLERKNHIL